MNHSLKMCASQFPLSQLMQFHSLAAARHTTLAKVSPFASVGPLLPCERMSCTSVTPLSHTSVTQQSPLIQSAAQHVRERRRAAGSRAQVQQPR